MPTLTVQNHAPGMPIRRGDLLTDWSLAFSQIFCNVLLDFVLLFNIFLFQLHSGKKACSLCAPGEMAKVHDAHEHLGSLCSDLNGRYTFQRRRDRLLCKLGRDRW